MIFLSNDLGPISSGQRRLVVRAGLLGHQYALPSINPQETDLANFADLLLAWGTQHV